MGAGEVQASQDKGKAGSQRDPQKGNFRAAKIRFLDAKCADFFTKSVQGVVEPVPDQDYWMRRRVTLAGVVISRQPIA